jgi:4-hydroxy-3-methylbut-2-enyl diphosphate reductase
LNVLLQNLMAVIEIDPDAGFCFGVDQVIRTAESFLRKGEKVYGLGEMVHNNQEMKRLNDLGLITITHEEIPRLKPARVLFRAHGEPPSSYVLAARHHVEVIDGTCPIVLKLQKRIGEAYRSMDHGKEQVVIFGKRDHPETIGLLGQVDGDAVVIESPAEIHLVDPKKAVRLFSQTTMDPDLFKALESKLKVHLKESMTGEFHSSCTICGQMKRRKPALSSFARKHDVILFVSGKNSSNGKLLFKFCRSLNQRTYWISGHRELDPGWFTGAGSIGISGATSTSREQLESVRDQVKKFILS